MNATTLESRHDATRARLRVVALSAAGAAVGAAIATSVGAGSIGLLLGGIALPLLAWGPRRARSADAWLRRGAVALAAVVLANATFSVGFGIPAVSWVIATVAMLVALGANPVGDWRRRAFDLAMRATGIGGGFAIGWLVVERMYYAGAPWIDAVGPALFGGLTALGAVAGDAFGTLRAPEPPRAALPEAPALFGRELDGVMQAAADVHVRLRALDTGAAGDAALMAHVLSAVDAVTDDARQAVARWRAGGADGGVTRLIEMRRRCRDIERQRDGAGDARVAAEAERTLATLRRAIEALERNESARHAFGLRLDQARAQLELLDASIQQAITAGRRLDLADVESAVELLEETQAFLDTPDDNEGWSRISTPSEATRLVPALA